MKKIMIFDKNKAPLCACGCGERVKGQIYKRWNKFIAGHQCKGRKLSKEHKRKLSIAQKGRIFSKETRKKLSIINTGKKLTEDAKKKISIAFKGKKLTKEHILKIAIGNMKCRTDGYCDAWSDDKYKKDCKKNYCEICGIKEEKKIDIMGRDRSNLLLHHADLNSKNCCPDNLPTLCRSCHMILHHALNRKKEKIK